MSRRRNKGEWISNVEQHGRRWRFKVGSGATTTQTYSFATREEAEAEHHRASRAQAKLEKEQQSLNWEQMVERYLTYQSERGKATPRSLHTLEGRLRRFFESVLGEPVRLTPEVGKQLYQKLRERKKKSGAALSVQEQHHALSRAKAFVSWVVKEKFLSTNHLVDLEPLGRPNRGKPQLTRDESVKLLNHCLISGGEGGVAVAVALLLGLRASEITERVVRDLDGRGTLLHITRAKTDAGVRTLRVPAVIRPLLLEQVRGKEATSPLLGHDRWWLRREVQRLCKEARVPVVPPHGLRGTHASLARQVGATPELVATSLGHAGTGVQDRHYVKQEAADEGRQGAVEAAILGPDSLPNHFPGRLETNRLNQVEEEVTDENRRGK